MADAFVNRFASESNLPIRAISAGTMASREVNPTVVAAMSMIGIPIDHQLPKQIMQWHVDHAEKVITMHCGVDPENCPARFFEREDWSIDDPAGQPLEAVVKIRDQIRFKVDELIATLSKPDAAVFDSKAKP